MALINQGGKLLLKNGALAGGTACCCGKCSGPCPTGVTDCPVGCGCSSGQCVECASQAYCRPGMYGFGTCPPGCCCLGNKCVGYSLERCDLPSQITMTLSGMGALINWQSKNGGYIGTQGCPDPEGRLTPQGWPVVLPYTPFCGCGPEDGNYIFVSNVGVYSGPAGYTADLALQDFTAVLDLQPGEHKCGAVYEGYAPGPPSERAYSGFSGASVDCGGELGVLLRVSIGLLSVATTVWIAPPTNDGSQAAAEPASVDTAGGITGVAITDPGSGYAREIFQRTAPTITASVAGGAGAAFRVTLSQAGSGEEATWSVSAIELLTGGAGYPDFAYVTFSASAGTTVEYPAAAYIFTGRLEPTVVAAVSGGEGAELSVALAKFSDFFSGGQAWRVSSVGVVAGGSGYSNGSSVTFTVTDGTQQYAANATINTGRSEPALTASAPSGAGATFTVTTLSNATSPNSWGVASVAVSGVTSGYQDGAELSFGGSGVTEESPASVVIRTGRVAPTLSAGVAGWHGGSGAQLTPTLTEIVSDGGLPAWTVSGLDIVTGGSGYSPYDYIYIAVTDGQLDGSWEFYGHVESVDESGAITSVTIYSGGRYFKSNGQIDSLQVISGGQYYYDTGIIESVTLGPDDGGSYYKATGTITAVYLEYGGSYYVATSTGTAEIDTPEVRFSSPTGNGTTATATVDGVVGSPTFGTITAITVGTPGSGHLLKGAAWGIEIYIAAPIWHLAVLTGGEPPPVANPGDPNDCANFSDKAEPLAERVLIATCPAALLSKSYRMYFASNSAFGDPSGEGIAQAEWCRTPMPSGSVNFSFFDFGKGPITCTLSPA